jgi:hypothetical protein
MGRVAEKILAALAAEVSARTEWDEPPALYFLYVEGGKARISQAAVPEFLWSADAPPRVLARIADSLGEFSGLLSAVAPEGLHGAAFRCEAWVVDAGKPGTERRSEVSIEAMAKRLDRHPDRVESRCMYAVDRAGATYSAVQAKGSAEVKRSVSYRKPGNPDFSGIIPDALDRFVTAMLGVEMPGRSRLG